MKNVDKRITNRFVAEFKPEFTDVAICGSMTHKEQIEQIIAELESAGLAVSAPAMSEAVADWSAYSDVEIIDRKGYFVRRHFANIALARAVLVCNFAKRGTDNYIGTNSLMEMTAGFVYGKPLYLLNPVPEQNGREEILAMQPTILSGNVAQLVKEIEADT